MGLTGHVVLGHWAGDDDTRTRARDWVTEWWQRRGLPVTTGVCDCATWCKAHAYNQTAANVDADVVIVADADSILPAPAVRWALTAAQAHGWAVPFDKVHRLDRNRTNLLLTYPPTGVPTPEPGHGLAQPVHDALPGGGIVAVRRDVWDQAGGFDPRFAGWGGEDYALGAALRTFAGPAAILPGALWHLWHTPQPDCRAASPETDALAWRYRKAKFRPDDMRALIAEWRQP